jgi:hypothetical protein
LSESCERVRSPVRSPDALTLRFAGMFDPSRAH